MRKLPIADLFPGASAVRSGAAHEVLYGGSKTRSCVSAEGKKMDEFQDGILGDDCRTPACCRKVLTL